MKIISRLAILIFLTNSAIASDYAIVMNHCSKPSWEPDKVSLKNNQMIIRLNNDKVTPQVFYLQGNKLQQASYQVDGNEITVFGAYEQILLKNSKNPAECSYDISLKDSPSALLPIEKQLLINKTLNPPSKAPAGGYVNTIDY